MGRESCKLNERWGPSKYEAVEEQCTEGGTSGLRVFVGFGGGRLGRGTFWSKSSRKERWLSRIAKFIISFYAFYLSSLCL